MINVTQKSATPPPSTPSIKKRIAGMIYESLLVAAITFVAAILFTKLASPAPAGTLQPPLQGLKLHLFQGYLLLVNGIYFIWFWTHGGQTLPMKTWRFRVTDANGQPVSFLRAGWRYLLAVPSVLLFGVGIFWALMDRDRQFLHDRLAGTRLITSDGLIDKPGLQQGG